jgi:hypothetical protein
MSARKVQKVPVRVWAPLVGELSLQTADGVVQMSQDDVGYWTAELPLGTDYRLLVDEQLLLPDPGARWFPTGYAGPARAFDPAAFPWTDEKWGGVEIPGSMLYEMHIGLFTPEGTFEAAATRLEHLRSLGVTAVEIMPVGVSPGRGGWGYDSALPEAVRSEFGGPMGLQRFVNACHAVGLGVVLDVVYNHLGPQGAPHKYLAPYFHTEAKTPWGKAMNFSQPGHEQVRMVMAESARRWLADFHLDGLRLDAVQHLSTDGFRSVTEDIRNAVDRLGRETWKRWLIAELSPQSALATKPIDEGGFGVDMCWDFWIGGHLRDLAEAGGDGERRRAALRNLIQHHRDAYPERWVSAYLSHDILGNTATGERPAVRVDQGLTLAIMALHLTMPCTRMLFMGEEWGATSPFPYFVGYDDRVLLDAIRAGRAAELTDKGCKEPILDPAAPETVASAQLRWGEMSSLRSRTILELARRLSCLGKTRAWSISWADPDRLALGLSGPCEVYVNVGDFPYPVQQFRGLATCFGSLGITLLDNDSGSGSEGVEATVPPRSVVLVSND